ncbi:sigma-54 dependent transcriptional regulator [Comamonas humi]
MTSDSTHILVVDDEPDLRTLYELTLLREGYRVSTAASVTEAREQLAQQSFHVLITDMRLPDGMGMELLLLLRQQQRNERCIVITAYGSADNAVAALREGAFDYLTKPVDLKQFRQVVASASQGVATESGRKAPEPKAPQAPGGVALQRLVGTSAAMQQVRERVAKVASSMAPVLIHGESGTGKELAAQALHALSQRAGGPLIAVNCGAIPENLLEAEFFGARKGSYTGAAHDRDGFFQAARGGTLFLDEIGELPLSMQAKLLRAVQERKVRRLGDSQEESVDVRIVSATHRDLASDVQAGRFRQDLYYRINVIEVVIPPLRERREDLPQLCEVLLERLGADSPQPLPRLTPAALQQIARHPLPGNVRELENLLQRAAALSDGAELRIEPPMPEAAPQPPADGGTRPVPLEPALAAAAAVPAAPEAATPAYPREKPLPSDLQGWMDQQERDILIRALRESGFNRTAAASRLGISLRQIRYRMDRLQINDSEGAG